MNLVYPLERAVKQAGYLLIEMIIALATVLIFSLIVAYMHALMIDLQMQADRYNHALNLAQNALSHLQVEKPIPTQSDNGFTIATKSWQPDPHVPFILHSATVSFELHNQKKEIAVQAGAIKKHA